MRQAIQFPQPSCCSSSTAISRRHVIGAGAAFLGAGALGAANLGEPGEEGLHAELSWDLL